MTMGVSDVCCLIIMTVCYMSIYTANTTDTMKGNTEDLSKHMSRKGSASCKIPPANITRTFLTNKIFTSHITEIFGLNLRCNCKQNWLIVTNGINFFAHFLYRKGKMIRYFCIVLYPECIFFNESIEEVGCYSSDIRIYQTLDESSVVIRDFKVPLSVTFFAKSYRSSILSIVNVTCGLLPVSVRMLALLPSTMRQVNIIDTNCEVVIAPFDLSEELFAMNLTGSGKTVLAILTSLMAQWGCDFSGIEYGKLEGLISLDISNAYLQDEIRLCKNVEEMHTTIPAIENFYARNVIPEACIMYVKEYNYASCLLARFKYSKLREETNLICINPETLAILDLSNNNIECIDSSFTNALINLTMLDVSNNLLNMSHGGAGIGLGRMTRLTVFYCSNNELRTLPLNIFDTLSNLTEIDLSFNKLKSITFRVQHLHQLRFLSLRKNEIKVFESAILKELSHLVMYQDTYSNMTIKLDLFANPFQCSCKTKNTMVWLLEHKREIEAWPLSCLYDGKANIINKRTLEYVEELCRRSLYIGSASLLCTIAAVVIIISAVAIYKHQLGMRRERRLLQLIRKFKEDNVRDKFPVFLSFSSSNADFVMENVFDELNTRLQELLGTNRRCVAIGDADFRPGALVVEEMIRCISKCEMVIICVSNDFLRSPWCTDEVRITHCLRKTIILMFLEEADKKLLAKSILLLYFSTACRAKWTEAGGRFKLQPDWHVFCDTVVSHMCEQTADPEEVETMV